MNVLILLEDEQYKPICEVIKHNSNFQIEVSNIDFNLTKSITNSQLVLYLGDAVDSQFLTDYSELLKPKMFVTNATGTHGLGLEVEVTIKHGLVFASVPKLNAEINQIINESLKQLFSSKYKVISSSHNQYLTNLANFNKLYDDIENLIDDADFSKTTLVHFLHNFNN